MEKMKTIFDARCQYRVADFEKAQQNMNRKGIKISFSDFKYHADTMFVWNVIGVVTKGTTKLRIEWNYMGMAFIGDEHTPEFDLIINSINDGL